MQNNIFALVGLIAVGFPLRAMGRKLKIPPAAILITLGVLASTNGFDLIPESYQSIRSQLSIAAFVVLLLRAGLGMEPKAMGGMIPGIVVLGVIPALAEMTFIAGSARLFLFDRWDLSLLSAFLIAAVSPAVILPTMLDQKQKGRGGPRLVPDRIMGFAVVNSFVAKTAIVLLLGFIVGSKGHSDVGRELALLPLRVLGGVLLGFLSGRVLVKLFPQGRDNQTLIWAGSGVVLLTALGLYFREASLGIEGVFAVLALGLGVRLGRPTIADQFKEKFNGLWAVAEIPLFVNVGMLIDLGRLSNFSLVIGLLGLLTLGLAFRKWAAWFCSAASDLTRSERFYVTLAQVPKATIQAAFGPIVFAQLGAMGPELSEAGQLMLIMAVLAIAATAPIGAVVLDRWGGRLLQDNETVPPG